MERDVGAAAAARGGRVTLMSSKHAMTTTALAGAVCMLALLGPVGMHAVEAEDAVSAERMALPRLTPGDRIIAHALYAAQPRNVRVAGPRWTLKQLIVARDDGRDWDAIFHDMKAAGLVRGTDLGRVLSAYLRPVTIKEALNEKTLTGIGVPALEGQTGLEMPSDQNPANGGGAAASSFVGGVDSAAGGIPAGQRGGVSGGHGHGRGR